MTLRYSMIKAADKKCQYFLCSVDLGRDILHKNMFKRSYPKPSNTQIYFTAE